MWEPAKIISTNQVKNLIIKIHAYSRRKIHQVLEHAVL